MKYELLPLFISELAKFHSLAGHTACSGTK